MRKFLSVLIPVLLGTGAVFAAADPWRAYLNPRFGVAVEYPSAFTVRDPPPDNGDGQGFRTADGSAKLLMFGSYNIDHETSAQLMQERKAAGTRYSYSKATRSWFVLSGTKGSDITYLRCNLGAADVVGCAELDYPASDAARWAAAVGRISASLRVK